MKKNELLKANQKICKIHADRLKTSLDSLQKYIPFHLEKIENFNASEIAFLDMLTTRFAKLQDNIGNKIFPGILWVLDEDVEGKSFLDIINRLEKLQILPSAQDWREMREIRNHITHEYPDNPELMIKNLNTAVEYIKTLLDYWVILSNKIDGIAN